MKILFFKDQREMMMRGLDEKNKKTYIRSMERKRKAMKEKEQSKHNDKKIQILTKICNPI